MSAIACGRIEDGTVARVEGGNRMAAIARHVIASEVLEGTAGGHPPRLVCSVAAAAQEGRADRVVRDLLEQGIALR